MISQRDIIVFLTKIVFEGRATTQQKMVDKKKIFFCLLFLEDIPARRARQQV